MALQSSFPVFITPSLALERDFYVKFFGFRVAFEAEWYVQLHADRVAGGPPLELAFLRPELPNQPTVLHGAFPGQGVILTMEVESVDASYRELEAAGALGDVIVSPRNEPWGQRHFLIRDPAGILLDVVTPIPPAVENEGSYAGSEPGIDAP
jgi:catechol 2,3-dioxygenase-like lactoylglutathione lyase family enzyme